MPATPHVEAHFEASATVRGVVIGMSDGLASAAAFGLARWIS
jgi:NH3-dependent NAD+ synthetase